jgi:hypothetical protein
MPLDNPSPNRRHPTDPARHPTEPDGRPDPPVPDTDLIAARRIAQAWSRLFGPDAMCIEATRCGIEALGRLGIPARPLPCAITVFNQFALAVAGRGIPVDEWPPWAHSVAVVPDPPDSSPGNSFRERRWNGHLVIEGDTFIADLTLGAFARPDRNLVVHATAWAKDREIVPFAGTWAAACGTAGVVITPRPELAAWRTGSAWRRRPDPDLIAYLAAAAAATTGLEPRARPQP